MKIKKIKNNNDIWLYSYQKIYGTNILNYVLLIQKTWRIYLDCLIKNTKKNLYKLNGNWRHIRSIGLISTLERLEDLNNHEYTIQFDGENSKVKYSKYLNNYDNYISLKQYDEIQSCAKNQDKKRELSLIDNELLIKHHHGCKEIEDIYKSKQKQFDKQLKNYKTYFTKVTFHNNRLFFYYNIFFTSEIKNLNIPYNYYIYNNDFMYFNTGKYYKIRNKKKDYKELRYFLFRIKENKFLINRALKRSYLLKLDICYDIISIINFYLDIENKFFDKNIIKIQKAWCNMYKRPEFYAYV